VSRKKDQGQVLTINFSAQNLNQLASPISRGGGRKKQLVLCSEGLRGVKSGFRFSAKAHASFFFESDIFVTRDWADRASEHSVLAARLPERQWYPVTR